MFRKKSEKTFGLDTFLHRIAMFVDSLQNHKYYKEYEISGEIKIIFSATLCREVGSLMIRIFLSLIFLAQYYIQTVQSKQ